MWLFIHACWGVVRRLSPKGMTIYKDCLHPKEDTVILTQCFSAVFSLDVVISSLLYNVPGGMIIPFAFLESSISPWKFEGSLDY